MAANVGDSEVVLNRGGQPVVLTTIHNMLKNPREELGRSPMAGFPCQCISVCRESARLTENPSWAAGTFLASELWG